MVLHEQLRPISDDGRSGEQGFTLIEVMFATVYLAVGLLAIAAMQDLAISSSSDAKRMSVATNMAAEMLERIRYNSPANATAPYPYNNIQACSSAATCADAPGSSAANQMASGDYNQWRARMKATDGNGVLLLPGATGTVTSVSTGSAALGQVLVTVQIKYSAGLRTPTITMSTIVAPL